MNITHFDNLLRHRPLKFFYFNRWMEKQILYQTTFGNYLKTNVLYQNKSFSKLVGCPACSELHFALGFLDLIKLLRETNPQQTLALYQLYQTLQDDIHVEEKMPDFLRDLQIGMSQVLN